MSGRIWICCWLLTIALSLPVHGSGGQPAAGHTYALVLSGIVTDPNERDTRERLVDGLRTHLLEKAGAEPRRLTVLVSGNPSSAAASEPSTADNLKKAIDAYVSAVGPSDQLLVFYTGQANVVTGTLRLNLPGPDVTHEDLARWLNAVRAARQLVVLDCPCAAMAAKALARRGRVVLCASNESQPYATRFGVHLVPALGHAQNDANHDGRVSVLEAFTAAAREIEQWYQQSQLLQTETPCLEDNGDGVPSERPWRFELDDADGQQAAGFFLTAMGASNGR